MGLVERVCNSIQNDLNALLYVLEPRGFFHDSHLKYFRIREMNSERQALEKDIRSSGQELEQLNSIKKQKIQTLAKDLKYGKDAVLAMKWLQNHKDEFSGHVYEPIMVAIDVHDAAKNAKVFMNYVEY